MRPNSTSQGVRAELSLKNLGAEIADFSAAMPPAHPLHIGLYFSGYSDCASPSANYTREALVASLSNVAVAGATIYITAVPRKECVLGLDQLPMETDKVRRLLYLSIPSFHPSILSYTILLFSCGFCGHPAYDD